MSQQNTIGEPQNGNNFTHTWGVSNNIHIKTSKKSHPFNFLKIYRATDIFTGIIEKF